MLESIYLLDARGLSAPNSSYPSVERITQMTSLFGDKAHARASPLLVHTNYARVLSVGVRALPRNSFFDASL